MKTQRTRVPELCSFLTCVSFSEQVQTSGGEGQQLLSEAGICRNPCCFPVHTGKTQVRAGRLRQAAGNTTLTPWACT